MLEHLDNGVGTVVNKLKAEGVWENTLLFFLTDNGGSKAMQANNGRLRAFKGSLYEGGIRTPWIVSWPAKFKGGRTFDQPVISLDILPTVVEATGTGRLAKRRFDGKSLLPLLTEKTTEHHPILFWNSGEEKAEWAVREGNWKAHSLRGKLELFDLSRTIPRKRQILQPSARTWPSAWPSVTPTGWRRCAARLTNTAWPSTGKCAPGQAKRQGSKARTKKRAERKKNANEPIKTVTILRNFTALFFFIAAINLANAKPNVLLIVCDDLNTHVSTSGYPHIKTPHLDRLAKAGITFNRAYCQHYLRAVAGSFLSGLHSGVVRRAE